MYERFTDRSRKVFQLANQIAIELNHEYISTEHILWGLVREGNGVAGIVLMNLDVGPGRIIEEIRKCVTPGQPKAITGKLPQTPCAKKVIELAIEAARKLNHNYIGTEHLLLGLLREDDSHAPYGANHSLARMVLKNLGVNDVEAVEKEIVSLIGSREKNKEGNENEKEASRQESEDHGRLRITPPGATFSTFGSPPAACNWGSIQVWATPSNLPRPTVEQELKKIGALINARVVTKNEVLQMLGLQGTTEPWGDELAGEGEIEAEMKGIDLDKWKRFFFGTKGGDEKKDGAEKVCAGEDGTKPYAECGQEPRPQQTTPYPPLPTKMYVRWHPDGTFEEADSPFPGTTQKHYVMGSRTNFDPVKGTFGFQWVMIPPTSPAIQEVGKRHEAIERHRILSLLRKEYDRRREPKPYEAAVILQLIKMIEKSPEEPSPSGE